MKFVCLLAGLSLSFSLQALEIKGRYVLAEPCRCYDRSSAETECPSNLPALQVFSKSVLQNNPYAEGYPDGPNQTWFYGNSRETISQFVIRSGDELEYSVEKNGRDLTVTSKNLTNPQSPFSVTLQFPEDRAGGAIDGATRDSTIETRSAIRFTQFRQSTYEAPTPAEMVKGTQSTEAQFSVELLPRSRLQVRRNYVLKVLPVGAVLFYTINHSELICDFKPAGR